MEKEPGKIESAEPKKIPDMKSLKKWAQESNGFFDEKDINKFLDKVTLQEGKIIVNGDLELNPEIQMLPPNLHIRRDLIISYAEDLKRLPAGLHVERDIEMKYTSIKHMPNDIYVGGDITIDSGAPDSLIDDMERLMDENKIRGDVMMIAS